MSSITGRQSCKLWVVLALWLSLTVAAAATEPVTIEFWMPASFADGIRDRTIDQIIEAFHEQHPTIRVIHVPNLPDRPERGEQYFLAAATNTLPALGWVAPEEMMDLYTEAYILPVDQLFARDGLDSEQFWPGVWGNDLMGGRQWGYPFEVGNEALIYNADLFDAAGIVNAPATWDELVQVSRLLTRYDNSDTPTSYGFQAPSTSPHNVLRFLWRARGAILSDDMMTVTYHTPENVRGLQFYADLRLHSGVAGGSFQRGTAAMIEVHSGWYGRDFDFNIGTASAPYPEDGQRLSRNYYKELVIFRSTPEQEEATWTFLQWLMRPDNNGLWAVHSGYLPVTREALFTEPFAGYLQENPMLHPWIEEMAYTRYLPPQPIIDVFGATVNRVLAGEAPASALAATEGPAQAALDEFWGKYPHFLPESND